MEKKIVDKKEVPFRSILKLNDYCDNEYFEPDTSETEEGQEVPVKVIYERCLRGELPPLLSGDYDIKGQMDLDDAFDTLDVTKTEGFDLADVTAFKDALAKQLSKGEEVSGRSEEQPTQKASDERDLKENSDATDAFKEQAS